MKYLLPNYNRGDRYLRKIAQRAHRITHPLRVSKNPNTSDNMLTYGYLGNVARHARRCQKDPTLSPYRNIFIADHGFGPKHLRNNIYRLTIHDKTLRGVELSNNEMLTSRYRNSIYAYLKEIQQEKPLKMIGQWMGQPADSMAILVEAAPVLVDLQLVESFKPSQYTHRVLKKAKKIGCSVFSSHKRLEIGLTTEGERKKTIHNSDQIEVNPEAISFVACPTSMMALSLILKGIPVELSAIHPLVNQLGLYTPALSAGEAIEKVYETICRTTFCMRKIRSIEGWIETFDPDKQINSSVVKL